MKRFLTMVFLLLAVPLAAQERDIQAVIEGQREAFQDRDVGQAFSYASPMIKGMFGTSQNFGMMVRQGYPMVWDNAETLFLDLRDEGGLLWQRVQVRDSSGGFHMLDYQMIETENGWQINGVRILPAPDLGV